MRCETIAELVKLWEEDPNAGISKAGFADLQAHLESCPACRARYGSLSFFIGREYARAPESIRPEEGCLPGFEDSVMRMIRESESKKERRSLRVMYRYPRFAAAAAALVFIFVFGFVYRGMMSSPEPAAIPVHFTFNAPEADSVVLVGSFPGWSADSGRSMKRSQSGQWELTVYFDRSGIYTYNFLVDGTEWVPDPAAAETVDDGFGGLNSLIRL